MLGFHFFKFSQDYLKMLPNEISLFSFSFLNNATKCTLNDSLQWYLILVVKRCGRKKMSPNAYSGKYWLIQKNIDHLCRFFQKSTFSTLNYMQCIDRVPLSASSCCHRYGEWPCKTPETGLNNLPEQLFSICPQAKS